LHAGVVSAECIGRQTTVSLCCCLPTKSDHGYMAAAPFLEAEAALSWACLTTLRTNSRARLLSKLDSNTTGRGLPVQVVHLCAVAALHPSLPEAHVVQPHSSTAHR